MEERDKKQGFTKREKAILIGGAIITFVVWVRMKNDLFTVDKHYNSITGKLCSGGIWMATNINSLGFDLVQIIPKVSDVVN